jgi:hypothetical protein
MELHELRDIELVFDDQDFMHALLCYREKEGGDERMRE